MDLSVILESRGGIVERFDNTYLKKLGNTVYISCVNCISDAENLKEMLLEKYPELNISNKGV